MKLGMFTFFSRAALVLALMFNAHLAVAQSEPAPGGQQGKDNQQQGFTQDEVLNKANAFFGETTEGLAKAIEKVFEDQGSPNAIIAGEEVSEDIAVGVRYGQGELKMVTGETHQVFWQGH